ncbi:hypothetical protein BGY98DRAFT_1055144, partial [Russula aff. rugulosa BPL654]
TASASRFWASISSLLYLFASSSYMFHISTASFESRAETEQNFCLNNSLREADRSDGSLCDDIDTVSAEESRGGRGTVWRP